MRAENCDFCRIARGTLEARIVYNTDTILAFLPLTPAAKGHTLVVPRSHVRDFLDLEQPLASELTSAVLKVAAGVQHFLQPPGMNLITSSGPAATQTVFHLHVHVLPRWNDDAFELAWPSHSTWSDEALDDVARQLRLLLKD